MLDPEFPNRKHLSFQATIHVASDTGFGGTDPEAILYNITDSLTVRLGAIEDEANQMWVHGVVVKQLGADDDDGRIPVSIEVMHAGNDNTDEHGDHAITVAICHDPEHPNYGIHIVEPGAGLAAAEAVRERVQMADVYRIIETPVPPEATEAQVEAAKKVLIEHYHGAFHAGLPRLVAQTVIDAGGAK